MNANTETVYLLVFDYFYFVDSHLISGRENISTGHTQPLISDSSIILTYPFSSPQKLSVHTLLRLASLALYTPTGNEHSRYLHTQVPLSQNNFILVYLSTFTA